MDREIKFRQEAKLGGWHYWGFGIDGQYFVGPLPPNLGGKSYQFTEQRDRFSNELYSGNVIHAANADIEGVVVWNKAKARWDVHTSEGIEVALWRVIENSACKIGTIHDDKREMDREVSHGEVTDDE